jgi:hypothetical protein
VQQAREIVHVSLLMRLSGIALTMLCAPALAQQLASDLAAAAQNPVAAMYSLPFQNNVFGGAGPTHDAVGNALNIQPMLPHAVWNELRVRARRHQPDFLHFAGCRERLDLGGRSFDHRADGDKP